jgi:hypothetical protein
MSTPNKLRINFDSDVQNTLSYDSQLLKLFCEDKAENITELLTIAKTLTYNNTTTNGVLDAIATFTGLFGAAYTWVVGTETMTVTKV